ncbi:DUF3806 domain-containing protein [Parahaliea mediterranea]|uniref:DUF3806 domain-containing protein n=1 Tax=Parahaliea mediterranea TaxID=651086 RepID=A0A939INT4_9GAMM|nr:DUF3806 domain-containing protein [Parahaliea mediterranea]MBN7798453.1 DUF3806 domain-containing protein [Parahaliea mediterranea]
MALWRISISAILGCLLVLAPASGALAQDTPRIDELSYLDRQYMSQQRSHLEDLARRHFGRGFDGTRANDLDLLQRMLDDRVVRPGQTQELQAMGIVMGDLLAEHLGMHWVVYEDRIGRSRALRYKTTENYLFPMTMISRRREAGNDTPVADIYQKAYDIIAPLRPDIPFQ